MKAVILAAGFGTRLFPLTTNKPKALLEIGGKTLLDHLVQKIEPLPKIEEVVVVTNSLFYGDFVNWKENASYRKLIHIEKNTAFLPEERAGAVRDLFLGLTARQNRSEDYLVLCADNYFDFPLTHFLLPCLSHPAAGFIGIYDIKDQAKANLYGVVEINASGKVVDFQEKPSEPRSQFISVGMYYFPQEFLLRVFEYLEIEKLNPDRMGDFIAWLSQKESLYGIECHGQWFDVGNIQSYDEAKRAATVDVTETA